MGGPVPLEGATVKAKIEVSELARKVADLVFRLEAVSAVEDWQDSRREPGKPRPRHPCNPGPGGDWADFLPGAPEWFAAEIERVNVAPLRVLAAGRELHDAWPAYRGGAEAFASSLAHTIAESGGSDWAGECPPRTRSGVMLIAVTASTVRLDWALGAWRGPRAVAVRRLADARRRNPGGGAARYWAARLEGLDGGRP
jgi:hypothetical protein